MSGRVAVPRSGVTPGGEGETVWRRDLDAATDSPLTIMACALEQHQINWNRSAAPIDLINLLYRETSRA